MAFTRHSSPGGRQQESPDLEVTSDDIITSSYHGSDQVTEEELMGHFVENRVILTGLATVLGGCGGVEVQRGVRITEATLPHPQVSIRQHIQYHAYLSCSYMHVIGICGSRFIHVCPAVLITCSPTILGWN